MIAYPKLDPLFTIIKSKCDTIQAKSILYAPTHSNSKPSSHPAFEKYLYHFPKDLQILDSSQPFHKHDQRQDNGLLDDHLPFYFGGAERYLVDLVKLIKRMNYEVKVIQARNYKWTKVYDGIEFQSIDKSRSLYDFFPDLNVEFHKQTRTLYPLFLF